ncbi:MAG: glutamine--fructose-6-phosphate aminotransferase [isomerizing] [Paracoccaceae bacterium]|nr:MAG: glutamine--fructose-6-phosphate aminotransferase [isomerizing] [Paracoccaceae bacterium]
MCGIVGILGQGEVAPRLLAALKRLEYRGYDSAGIATLDGGRLQMRRAVGKLSALAERIAADPPGGSIGIGHTRWATHGAPSETNAHPQRAGRVAVVHNGIIENFAALRAELMAEGRAFASQTDTEVIAQLCDRELAAGASPEAAALAVLPRLEGAFAIAFLFEGHDDLIVAARRGSPLAIGHGEGEMFLGSDAIALAPMTGRITYLEEGDSAMLTRAGAVIRDAAGRPADRPVRIVSPETALVDKGNHRHFMLKEIHEQPVVVTQALGHYADPAAGRVAAAALGADFGDADRILLVACGTGHYACHVAKYWFERIARIPVEIDIASEFRYRDPPLSGREVAIFVSQSGETADTLAALRHARGRAGRILAVVNNIESSIAREADIALPILAGPEISVASTKAFTCQLMVLAMLAILAGRQRGRLDAAAEARLVTQLAHVPGAMNRALSAEPAIAAAAGAISHARDVLFLGRGAMYPLALEGALKLKELSYIHAEGYAAGEMKHGPIALIDGTVPVIVLAPGDGVFAKTLSNMQEVMARGARVILITDAAGAAAGGGAETVITMPPADPFVAPFVYAIPAQLIAYHAAVAKGTDVDQPRNLAKSVTVE